MKKTVRLVFTWLPPLSWMIFIFFLSSQPTTGITGTRTQRFFILKFFHLVEYSILFILFYRAFLATLAQKPKIALLLAVLASWLYGASDEAHQSFVSGREGRPRDVIIDLIGISLGVLILLLFRRLPRLSRLLGSGKTKE